MNLLDLFKESSGLDPKILKSWENQQSNVSDVYTLEDLNSHEKKKSAKSSGWRTKDGRKHYTTFRNGEKVVASGRNAFLLAKSDNKKHKHTENHSDILEDRNPKKKLKQNDSDSLKQN